MKTLRISVSDLVYFSGCRRKWLWGKTYFPRYPIPAFFLGNAVHDGLEAYYKTGGDSGKTLAAVEKKIDKILTEVAHNTVEFGGDSANEEYEELADLARQMVINYMKCYELDYHLGTPIDVEARLRVIVPTPQWEYPSITLSGRADLIFEDLQRDVWIMDHKTSSTYSVGLPGLDVDEQLTAYMYLYWKKTGIVPKGVIYNILIKKTPKAPRILKSGELSQDKSQKTSYELYMKELQSRNLDPFKYEAILSGLKEKGWSDYFFRERATRNEVELRSFEDRFMVKASEIAAIYRDPDIWAYPSPSTYQCNYCQYLSACKSKEDGGDAESILKVRFKTKGNY